MNRSCSARGKRLGWKRKKEAHLSPPKLIPTICLQPAPLAPRPMLRSLYHVLRKLTGPILRLSTGPILRLSTGPILRLSSGHLTPSTSSGSLRSHTRLVSFNELVNARKRWSHFRLRISRTRNILARSILCSMLEVFSGGNKKYMQTSTSYPSIARLQKRIMTTKTRRELQGHKNHDARGNLAELAHDDEAEKLHFVR
ncbi:hypothetical protein GQ43DRAFT_233419 [Delitschia confertaspora ATCC 74209]|uniref:Uncharacterized protein n=1 Tax=Delitschia confertaspora ATCC 74209 TaxID=1513339 RepID=A0A9P4JCF0_9PLEO|nr:hypothetical protein GQ43DRAFT_233419 [Delitschia confertaspora ATCC 74209]